MLNGELPGAAYAGDLTGELPKGGDWHLAHPCGHACWFRNQSCMTCAHAPATARGDLPGGR